MFLTIYFLSCFTIDGWVYKSTMLLPQVLLLSNFTCFPWLFLDYNVPGLIIFSFSFSLWLTMVVLRSLSLSPPRPDTTLSSRAGGFVPTRNFPDKLRYRRRAALGEDRLADLRAGAGWWAWSPLMGCVILAESALEERHRWEKRDEYDIWFSTRTLWRLVLKPLKVITSPKIITALADKC